MRRDVERLGYECFVVPVLECRLCQQDPSIDTMFTRVVRGEFSWVALLSPTAVYFFAERLEQVKGRLDTAPFRVAVQGHGTAAAFTDRFGREPDFVPTEFMAEEFVRQFAAGTDQRQKIFLPQARDGRDVVGPYLTQLGREVVSIALYETVPIPLAPTIIDELVKHPAESTVVTFLSPSAVEATFRVLEEHVSFLTSVGVVSIGPSTSAALEERGVVGVVEADVHSEDGVLAALSEHFPPASNRRPSQVGLP